MIKDEKRIIVVSKVNLYFDKKNYQSINQSIITLVTDEVVESPAIWNCPILHWFPCVPFLDQMGVVKFVVPEER